MKLKSMLAAALMISTITLTGCGSTGQRDHFAKSAVNLETLDLNKYEFLGDVTGTGESGEVGFLSFNLWSHGDLTKQKYTQLQDIYRDNEINDAKSPEARAIAYAYESAYNKFPETDFLLKVKVKSEPVGWTVILFGDERVKTTLTGKAFKLKLPESGNQTAAPVK